MKDAKGHGSDKRGGGMTPVQSENAPFKSRFAGKGVNYLEPNDPRGIGRRQAAMARLEASGKIPAGTLKTVAGILGADKQQAPFGRMQPGISPEEAAAFTGAHSKGIQQVGQPTPAPSFRMNSYTHEIVSPTGEVAARVKLGKNNGLAVDEGKGGGISRSGGPSIHDAVAMPDYMASQKGSNSFPADHISGALHFLTGNDFAGHTVRRVKG
jgi:hypothetical protein